MDKKSTTVLIALIGIGLYALPSTVALFSGQHSFENIDATGNQIDCEKCHGDVSVELGANGASAPHEGFACEFCHRVEAGEASGDNAYSQITYSAINPVTSAKVNRKLIVTEADMEARNVPIDMTGTTVSTRTISGNVMGKNKVSECYISIAAPVLPEIPEAAGTCSAEDLLLTFVPPEPKSFQATSLYNPDGTPKDTTIATRLGAFDASKITYLWTYTAPRSGTIGTWALTSNFDGAGSEVSNPGTSYHAASLVSCLECHGGTPTGHHDAEYADCNACHYSGGANKGGLAGIMAGGFGLGVSPGDTGATEAHKDFTKNNDGLLRYNSALGASNTACVACHTHVKVDITFDKPTTIKFDTRLGRTPEENATFSNEAATGSMISSSAP